MGGIVTSKDHVWPCFGGLKGMEINKTCKKSVERCYDRLSDGTNGTKAGCGGSKLEPRGAPEHPGIFGGAAEGLTWEGSGAALSILDTKIQRKQNRRD